MFASFLCSKFINVNCTAVVSGYLKCKQLTPVDRILCLWWWGKACTGVYEPLGKMKQLSGTRTLMLVFVAT